MRHKLQKLQPMHVTSLILFASFAQHHVKDGRFNLSCAILLAYPYFILGNEKIENFGQPLGWPLDRSIDLDTISAPCSTNCNPLSLDRAVQFVQPFEVCQVQTEFRRSFTGRFPVVTTSTHYSAGPGKSVNFHMIRTLIRLLFYKKAKNYMQALPRHQSVRRNQKGFCPSMDSLRCIEAFTHSIQQGRLPLEQSMYLASLPYGGFRNTQKNRHCRRVFQNLGCF